MKEVSARSLQLPLLALQERGIPRDAMFEGCRISFADIRRPTDRIDWDDFAEVLDRFTDLLGGIPALHTVGASFHTVSEMKLFGTLLRRVATARDHYALVHRFLGPSLASNIISSLVDQPDGSIEFTLEIPEPFRASRPYFHVCLGTFRAAPMLFRQPAATVDARISDRRATYRIALREVRVPLLRRITDRSIATWRSPRALQQLTGLQHNLRESLLALQQAEKEGHLQRAQLRQALVDQHTAEEDRRRAEELLHQAQKLESVGALAGGIAHDFNNLLSVIISNADLALAHLPVGHESSLYIERIRRSSELAHDMTDMLLTTTGRSPTRAQKLDLGALAADVAALISASLPAQQTISTAIHPSWVHGDPSQLHRSILNLLANASEACAGVPARIHIAVAQDDLNEVLLDVIDDGPGFATADLSKVLEPFYSTKGAGRGLGLAAVAGTVRGHGGVLEVDRIDGQHTRFRLRLPGVPAPSTDAASPQFAPLPEHAIPLLLVDDNAAVRTVLSEILCAAGFDVDPASNGAQAVAMAEARVTPYSAVLLDRSMPGMSGAQTFRALRALDPGLPVVLTSGNHDEEELNALTGLGLHSFLQKPTQPDELIRTLRNAARPHRQAP